MRMKKSNIILLVSIYIIVLVFTLFMETIGIGNQMMRFIVNTTTLLMAVICGILVGIIYQMGQKMVLASK